MTEWETNVAQNCHQETLRSATSATILPLLNPRFSNSQPSLNSYERSLAWKLNTGQTLSVISIMDLDGTVFPYPFIPYLSRTNLERDYRAGYRFVHEVARVSDITQVYTSRFVVRDTPPPFIPKELWGDMTSHFPLIRPLHADQITHLGDFKIKDEWVCKLQVKGGKTQKSVVQHFEKVLSGLSRVPDICYYFGDSNLDRRISQTIRNEFDIPLKFIRLGHPSRQL